MSEAKPMSVAERILREFTISAARMNRTNVTFTVDADHVGPPQMHTHPADGHFVECSPDQAQLIDAQFPLRFLRAVDPRRAEFDVVPLLPGTLFRGYFPPPYDPPILGGVDAT